MSASFLPTFSLCICTRNRPDDLRRALQSAQASTTPVHQLIVSDDSTDYRTRDMMLGEFPAITYLEGRAAASAPTATAPWPPPRARTCCLSTMTPHWARPSSSRWPNGCSTTTCTTWPPAGPPTG